MNTSHQTIARLSALPRRSVSSALKTPKGAAWINRYALSRMVDKHWAAISAVIAPAVQGAALAAVFIAAGWVANAGADIPVRAAEDVEKIKQQSAYINELEKVLAKCLTRGENALVIGDEIGFCGLVMTGIKTK